MTSHLTSQYEELIDGLGFVRDSGTSGDVGAMISGEALRASLGSGTSAEMLDKRFRYASVLREEKIGVTHVFELNGAPCLYFKSLSSEPTEEQIRDWHRTAWNHGLGRMLWIVTPQTVRVLNAFEPPEKEPTARQKHPAELLRAATTDLETLRKYELDRISLESGQFWSTRAVIL